MKDSLVDIEETNIGSYAILVDLEGKIILQQRDDKPNIMNPGKITMFGGSLKKSETEIQGLKREIFEELRVLPEDKNISKFNTYFKTKEKDGVEHTANVFIIKNTNIKDLHLNEGAGFAHDFPEVIITNPKLTRICKLAVQDFIDKTADLN